MVYALLFTGFYSLTFLFAGFASIKEFDDCVISFFQDPSSNTLVIKQMKDPSPDEQFLLVIDATACHIAEKNQIPMNKVVLIAANTPFSEKITPGLPATVHTIAPGIRTDEKNLIKTLMSNSGFARKILPWRKSGELYPQEMLV